MNKETKQLRTLETPTHNSIFIESHDEATHLIQHLILHTTQLLLVEDNSYSNYYGILNLKNISLYNIIVDKLFTSSFLISYTKFQSFVRMGLITKSNFDMVVFRMKSCYRDLKDCFRIFYYRNLKIEDERPLIIYFFGSIGEDDSITMHSSIHGKPGLERTKPLKYN